MKAIVNPDSGPLIPSNVATNLRIIGINSNGTVNRVDPAGNFSQYKKACQSIRHDQNPSPLGYVSYDYIKPKMAGAVVLNPGVNVSLSYFTGPQKAGDVIVTFENYHSAWASYRVPAELASLSADRFAAIIPTAPVSDLTAMNTDIDLSVARNFNFDSLPFSNRDGEF